MAVNCAALAQSLVASELFGHEAGAFTGATRRRPGRFELAHGGTLFLDEVAELAPDIQVMLLRVLQERVIERVGGTNPIQVDVRLIAATHQDLSAAMVDGRFRADLFYRLNVFPIQVPPLRQRADDIPDLVKYFLRHFGQRMQKPINEVDPQTLRLLTSYHWPGNVRELENLIERAVIVCTDNRLVIDPQWLHSSQSIANDGRPHSTFHDAERQTILDALNRCHGKIYGPNGAAQTLGLKPTTLYGKMQKLGISRPTAS